MNLALSVSLQEEGKNKEWLGECFSSSERERERERESSFFFNPFKGRKSPFSLA